MTVRRKLWAGSLAGVGSSGVALYTLAASLGAHAALVAVMAWAPAPSAKPPARTIDVDAWLLEPPPAPRAEPLLPASPAPLTKHGPPRERTRTLTAGPSASRPSPGTPAGPARVLPAAAAPEPLLPGALPAVADESAVPVALPAPAPPPLAPARAVPPGPPTVYGEGDVDQVPELLGAPRPTYPPSALRQGAEGAVVLALVVNVDGRVSEARVTRRAGLGFDEAALAAARNLRFRPGRKGGSRVPVRVSWTCRFQLEN